MALTQYLEKIVLGSFIKSLKFYKGATQIPFGEKTRDVNDGKTKKPSSDLYSWYVIIGVFCIDCSVGDLTAFTLSEKDKNCIPATTNGKLTFTLDGVQALAEHGYHVHMTDQEMRNKTQVDLLAKSLVYLQNAWFLGMLLQRTIAGLPISLLEHHTFLTVILAILTNICWWNKSCDARASVVDESITTKQLLPMIVAPTSKRALPKLCVQTGYDPRSHGEEYPRAALWLCTEENPKTNEPTDGAETEDEWKNFSVMQESVSNVSLCIAQKLEHFRPENAKFSPPSEDDAGVLLPRQLELGSEATSINTHNNSIIGDGTTPQHSDTTVVPTASSSQPLLAPDSNRQVRGTHHQLHSTAR